MPLDRTGDPCLEPLPERDHPRPVAAPAPRRKLSDGSQVSRPAGEEVRDGAIVCKEKKGGELFTKDEYDDFVVRLEFKLPPGGIPGLGR